MNYKTVLDAIGDDEMSAAELADVLGEKLSTLRGWVWRMKDQGSIVVTKKVKKSLYYKRNPEYVEVYRGGFQAPVYTPSWIVGALPSRLKMGRHVLLSGVLRRGDLK